MGEPTRMFRWKAACLGALVAALFVAGRLAAQQGKPGAVTVHHYHSELDDTDQPFSVWLPRNYSPARKWPVVIQLHGLGGNYRMGRPRREIEDCIVVAPDGRGNTDYKLWGELDVVRAVAEVKKLYSVDPDRVYLYGVSMGGSGSWQIGVHYPDLFAALGPICGNADHRVWEKLWLWGEAHPTYLTPKKEFIEATESPVFFAENLLNLPSWCIHGDNDNVVPCDHSRSMVAALRAAGCPVTYTEVPGMGHGAPGKETAEMLLWLKKQKRNPWPRRVVFKTAWRRHPGAYWVRVHRFLRPFEFATIEAEVKGPNVVVVKTSNLEEFSLHLVPPLVRGGSVSVEIDGRAHYRGPVPPDGWLRLRKRGERWAPSEEPKTLHKTPQLEGPIQHAFMSRFVIVYGASGPDERAKRVASDEARILADRWNRWARGRCRVIPDRDLKPSDIQTANLILIGDPATNSVAARVMPSLPIRVEGRSVVVGPRRYEGDDLGFKLVYPNPLNPRRYVVLFTGTTWRGVYQCAGRFGNWFDWGILDGWHWMDFAVYDDFSYSPETFLAVGFFDNDWRLNPDWTLVGNEQLRHARPPRKTPRYRKPPKGAGELYLSDLEPAYVREEKGAVGRDRSFNAFPLTLGGRTYERGLGVHPNCDIGFDLDGLFPTFEAVVGADLEDRQRVSDARARAESFEFLVVADGKVVYQSGRMRWNSPPRHIYVPIRGARRLELKAQRRSGPRWLSGPLDWAIARVGEPLPNPTPVVAASEGPLVEAIPLGGLWKVARFPVGEGIMRGARRAASEALEGAIEARLPASIHAILAAAGRALPPREVATSEWWLWRKFEVPKRWEGRSVWIELGASGYQADCWLNGRWVGQNVGAYARGRFEATKGARPGGPNTLAVRLVSAPVQWAAGPKPFRALPPPRLVTSQLLARAGYSPLGLWGSVWARSAGPAIIEDLHVRTDKASADEARLHLVAEVRNLLDDKLEATLSGRVLGEGFQAAPLAFDREAVLERRKSQAIELDLVIPRPRLWWPAGLGPQPLYRVEAALRIPGGGTSDERTATFGIRNIEPVAANGTARLRINGQPGGQPGTTSPRPSLPRAVEAKELTVRSAVWVPPDAALGRGPQRYRHLLALARQAGLNALHVAGGGLVEDDAFYDLCDRMGILLFHGLPLVGDAGGQDPEVFARNCEDVIRRLRNHPCLAAWSVGGAARPTGADPKLVARQVALCARLDPSRPLADAPAGGMACLWRRQPSDGHTVWRPAELAAARPPASPPNLATLLAAGLAAPPQGRLFAAQAQQLAAVQRAAEGWFLDGGSGVLWQFDEPLPGPSPALVDAAGLPKPAFYALKRLAGEVVVLADFWDAAPPTLAPGDILRGEVCVASRTKALRGAVARASVLDLSLRRLASWRVTFDAPPGVLARPLAFEWRPGASVAGEVCFLRLDVEDAAGQPLASDLYLLAVEGGSEPPRRLRVAWLTNRPAGPLADERFRQRTGIEVHRPLVDPETTAGGDMSLRLDGYDVVVLDAATALKLYIEADMTVVAQAVRRGCGLLVVGTNPALAETALKDALPLGPPALLPSGLPSRPHAVVPAHPVVRMVDFSTAPAVEPGLPTELSAGAHAIAVLDREHPLLAEKSFGEGRVLMVASPQAMGGWDQWRKLVAAAVGYLARVPHFELDALVRASDDDPLAALEELPPALVVADAHEEDGRVAVALSNGSRSLAFLVHLAPEAPGRLPLAFSENFLALLPGESRTVWVSLTESAEGEDRLCLGGWNVARHLLPWRLEARGGRLRLRR